MPTPRIYYALYNCIVESYKTVADLRLRLCVDLGARVNHEAPSQATAELINYCKYQGNIGKLIRLVLDDNRVRARARKQTLTDAMFLADQIAVSITPDLAYFIAKIPPSDWVKLLCKIEFTDIHRYYTDLGNALDQCRAHVAILGNPADSKISKDSITGLFFPLEIEHYCAFFWDIPTYFLLPERSQENWRSKICSIKTLQQQRWPQGEVRTYTDQQDMAEKFEALLIDLLRKDPWHYFPTRSTLAEKTANNDFDVFLCYNRDDESGVKKIRDKLRTREILPWLDIEQERPGLLWQKALQNQIKQIKSVAVFVGPNGLCPQQEIVIDAFLREFVQRGCPVIPVLLPDAPEQPELPLFLQGFTWVDFRKSDPDPLKQLIYGITGKSNL